ncbi:sigma factor-like helix-turn-helix DNA-binding protein [Rhodonellum sp.]|uniref:sigma factor-like helix-turn-helix DNA-binding protein n=1 Tax=Rhodonellum sp. TaxID=2231180 RepID=UPI002719FB16|nr:sigma factor-like helix-turn-helix DNA-binding protein [Rhodonellum sp.]MDO9553046.1 sigma factor-like helix-turn-helix DNA-binding protein [Rhodonellum sp.]
MVSIITGDIINSRKIEPTLWMVPLKEILNGQGNEPKAWEIFRGDHFQLEVKPPEESLLTAIKIKANIRSIKGVDVRMAIGIGEKTHDAPKISESNGSAFIHSGESFEKLKDQTLSLKTPWSEIDEEMNLAISLALMTMDGWTPAGAEIVKMRLEHPKANQNELAEILNISQGRVSERLKRAGWEQIQKLETRFRQLINNQIKLK